jgi:CshA-type fibril repeat protein
MPTPTKPPVVAPGAPTGLTVKTGDRRLELTYQPPAADGGAPVSGYEFTLDGTTWRPMPPGSILVDLENGTSYQVMVRAVNSAGPGPATPAVAAELVAPPRPEALSSTSRAPSIQRATVPLAEGETVTLLDLTGAAAASVTDGEAGTYRLSGATITFTPVLGYSGTPSGVTFRVTNAAGLSGTAVYTPTVTKPPTPAPPTVNPGPGSGGGTPGSGTPGTTPGTSPGTTIGTGRQAVKGELEPGQSISLMLPGPATVADAEVTTKIPVPGQGTYQLFRSGRAFTITFTPEARFVGRATGIQYRISDIYGQYVDASYRPMVLPPALPKIDRSGLAPVPTDPKRTTGRERRTKAYNASFRGLDAYPSTALGIRKLTRNQATTLAGGQVFTAGRITLTEQGTAAVRKLVTNLTSGQKITCEGYADYGTSNDRAWSLAQGRARTACAALKSAGADVTTTVAGYGTRRPAVVGGTGTTRTENWRVVIVVTG